MNKQKHTAKQVVLLGAGAMIPFGGPSTLGLTERIRANSTCDTIFRIIQKDYKDSCSFETLFSAVELLLEWSFSNESNGYISSLDTSIYKSVFQKADAFKYKSRDELWETYQIVANEIMEAIKDYDFFPITTGSHKGIDLDYLGDFIIDCSKKSSCKIYTLNYDRLIPRIVGKRVYVYEGIDNQKYSYDIKKFVNHPLTHFNLHGSIYLHYDSSNSLVLNDSPIGIGNSHLISGGNPNEHKIFLPIIAGYHKTQRILSEPFNWGAGVFMYDCNTCDELLIIGYSFGDPHINSFLECFIHTSSTNIVIVDYSQDLSLPRRTINRINRVFSQNTEFEQKDDGVYSNEDNKIIVYMKGFENYIKDYNC
jgi:hypothetical protein